MLAELVIVTSKFSFTKLSVYEGPIVSLKEVVRTGEKDYGSTKVIAGGAALIVIGIACTYT